MTCLRNISSIFYISPKADAGRQRRNYCDCATATLFFAVISISDDTLFFKEKNPLHSRTEKSTLKGKKNNVMGQTNEYTGVDVRNGVCQHAATPSTSISTSTSTSKSPLLRLPPEIRLMIYDNLFLPPPCSSTNRGAMSPPLKVIKPDVFTSPLHTSKTTHHPHGQKHQDAPPRLSIRTLSPTLSPLPSWLPSRSHYLTRTPAFHPQTLSTTYVLHPSAPHLRCSIALLRVCKLLHAEATAYVYSRFEFDFGTHVEALEPFLSDVGPLARREVRRVRVVRGRGVGEAEEADWRAMLGGLEALGNGVVVNLGVVGLDFGDSDDDGEEIPELTREYFEMVARSRGEELREEREQLEWAMQLCRRKRGLADVRVQALREHSWVSAPTTTAGGRTEESASVAFWRVLSRSLEKGFAEWMSVKVTTEEDVDIDGLFL